jgi:energy-coupling factor transport system permease protein
MQRFNYLRGNSFFHQMDPTWKLAWDFMMVILIILSFDIRYSAALFAYVVFLILFIARIPLGQYLRTISFFVVIGLFIAFWQSVYNAYGGTLLLAIGPLKITREGLSSGFGIFFRFMAIVSAAIIFTLTTDPARMVESLVQIIRIPNRIGYMLYAALRYIPLYENEAQIIVNAHQIRGVGQGGKGLRGRFKLTWSMIVPLLVSGLRRAQISALAMDSRGFGAYEKRTVLTDIQIPTSNKVFVGIHLLILLAAFYYFVILGHGVAHIG